MKVQLFTTDEEIISEYSKLSSGLGNSEVVLSATKNMIKQISQEMQGLWKPILTGLQYSSKGDGFEIYRSYNNTVYYLKAYEIFSDVITKINNKKSLLFIFVRKYQISCLALSRSKNINEIIPLFDNLINEFRNNKNEHIQTQVASTMLDKSFAIWEINKKNITNDILLLVKNIEDEIINTFSSSDIPGIQTIVASCLHNKANTISKELEINERKRIEVYTEIIKRFEDCEDDRLKIQISKALINKAFSLEQLNAIEETKNKWEIYLDKKNYEQEIIDTYSEQIEKFKHSNIPVIQEDVAIAMARIADISKNAGQANEALRNYNDLIKKFKDCKINNIIVFVASALMDKASLLESQAIQKQDMNILVKAKETYDELIDAKFIDYKSTWDSYNPVQEAVTMAMNRKADILFKQNELDAALALFENSIDRHSKYKNKALHFDALYKKILILLLRASKNNDGEEYKQAIEVCSKTLDLYRDEDISYQECIAVIMMNRVVAQKAIGCYSDAVNNLKEVIDVYGSKEYQKYESFQIIVNNATIEKTKIANTLPIYEIFDFYPTNEKTIYELFDSISKGNVIPVIGAGLSAFAGYPLWKDFLINTFNDHENLIQDITKTGFMDKSCRMQASDLKERLTKGIFENEVKRHFSDKPVDENGIKQQPIWLLPKLFKQQIILTTNFDNLIKLVFGLQKITSFDQCTRTDIDKIKSKTNISTLLYKINGTVDSFKDVILTNEDFIQAYNKEGDAYKGMQNTFQHNKDVLFLGCSLEERHEILDFVKDKNISIFTIYPCDDENTKVEIIKKLGENGITSPILYPPKDKHIYLFLLLEYISYSL
jgi:tetratricopeptide (TPR) repeat protein